MPQQSSQSSESQRADDLFVTAYRLTHRDNDFAAAETIVHQLLAAAQSNGSSHTYLKKNAEWLLCDIHYHRAQKHQNGCYRPPSESQPARELPLAVELAGEIPE
jgi:hypothetical protein